MAKVSVRSAFKLEGIIHDAVSARMLKAEGEILVQRIVNRTLSGRDEDGRPFKPYASSTSKSNARRFGSSTVDLYETGKMLGSLGITRISRNQMRIGFRSQEMEERARHHEEGHGGLPVRRFLGVPPSWLNDFVRKLKQAIR